jgi:hypothetical protein
LVATSVNSPTGDFIVAYERSTLSRGVIDLRIIESRAIVRKRQSATRDGLFAVADLVIPSYLRGYGFRRG